MISDVLAEAVWQIDDYLAEPVFTKCYVGDCLREVKDVRARMEALRMKLDNPTYQFPDDVESRIPTEPCEVIEA